MPNWRKIITSGSDATLSSLLVTNSITASIVSASQFTGSLFGTASRATNSLTASSVTTLNQNVIITGSVSINTNDSLQVTGGGKIIAGTVGGQEGGEILLGKPETNSTLTGSGITIDSYQNKIRFFEQGGDARGAYIDLTACAAGVTTNLLSGGGGTTFNGGTNIDNRIVTATGTSPELNGESNLTFNGSTLTITGNVTASSFTGSLLGTASFATTASFALNAGAGSGFPFSGSAVITGSLLVSGSGIIVTGSVRATSFTGSLQGTASWATNAVTASYPIVTFNNTIYSTGPAAGPMIDIPLNSIILGLGANSKSEGFARETTISDNIFIGRAAAANSTLGNISTFIGYNAGASSTKVSSSNFIGNSVGLTTNTVEYSNFIGYQSGNNVSASYSNFIGYTAGQSASNANNSNFIGNAAGYEASRADYSNFTGLEAGFYATSASYSNFIGYQAGRGAQNAPYSNFIGYQAGGNSIRANNANFIGYAAGGNSVSASYSVLIGYNAGFNANWGSGTVPGINTNNIIIGTNITLDNNRQDSINLGAIIFATGSYNVTTGQPFSGSRGGIGRVGINVTIPQYTLDVSGSGNYTNGLIVTGSLNASGSTHTITGSLRVTSITSSLLGTASFSTTASYVSTLRAAGDGANTTEIQYNEGGVLASNNSLTFDSTKLKVTRALIQGGANNTLYATGLYSHVEGDYNIMSGAYSHTEGTYNVIRTDYSHAEGYDNHIGIRGISFTGASAGVITFDSSDITSEIGNYVAIDNGTDTKIYKVASVNWFDQADPSPDQITITLEDTSFSGDGKISAFIIRTLSSATSLVGDYRYQHAEGYWTTTLGLGAKTAGSGSIAAGQYSYAGGNNTMTNDKYQTVVGQYNIPSSGESAFIIGNGTDDGSRSNLVYASGSEFGVTGSINVSSFIKGEAIKLKGGGYTTTIQSSNSPTIDNFYLLPDGNYGATIPISVNGTLADAFDGNILLDTIPTASFVNQLNQNVVITGSLIVSGSTTITGSLNVANITGSLLGTASFASTASFALNATAGGISQGKVVAIATGLANLF